MPPPRPTSGVRWSAATLPARGAVAGVLAGFEQICAGKAGAALRFAFGDRLGLMKRVERRVWTPRPTLWVVDLGRSTARAPPREHVAVLLPVELHEVPAHLANQRRAEEHEQECQHDGRDDRRHDRRDRSYG